MSDERTVWYRKWRPQTFAEITGQDHVTRTLRNAVAGKRVAHAYLLCGPRGTGKTTTARVLAKAVNCASPTDGEPCDRCESCIAVREGRALDLVEMDAASNRGIDDIRELRERVGYAASGGRYKVYLIDEVHELTQQAFDALLKTLEEPPTHVIFVLATTDAHRVPATIVSRCQRFDLTRARPPDIVARLGEIAAAEGVAIDGDALGIVARAATGSFRDAVGLLEQLVATYGATIGAEQARAGLGLTGDARALDLARMAIEGDLAGGLALIAAVRDDGVELRQFTREVVARLRALLLLRAGIEENAEADPAEQAALAQLARSANLQAITRALKAFAAADFRADPQASLPLELALVEVTLRPAAVAEPAAPTFAEARQARKLETADAHPAERPVAVAAAAPATPRAPTPAAPAPAEAPEPPRKEPQRAQPLDQLTQLRERLAARGGDATAPVRPEAPRAAPPEANPATPVSSDLAAAESIEVPRVDASHEVSDGTNGAVKAGPMTLADARAAYRQIYQHLRSASPLAAGRINPGDIVAADGTSITFGLPHKIQVDKLASNTDAYRLLLESVKTVFGRPLAVHCVHMPEAEDRLRATPTRKSHLLDEALKLGAQPLDSA